MKSGVRKAQIFQKRVKRIANFFCANVYLLCIPNLEEGK